LQMPLKLRNRAKFPYYFLIASTLTIAGWIRFAPQHPPELLLSIFVGIAGFAYFLYGQHLNETKLFKELFLEFNARYDKLNKELNAVLSSQADGALSASDRDTLFAFFNLCAEEYFFYTIGYVDQHVWSAWSNGMAVFFRHVRIRELWASECKTESYYGFTPPLS